MAVCARLEEEISALPESERQAFLRELGVAQSALYLLVKKATSFWASSAF